MEPFSTRYRLTKRRQGDRVSGEVYLTITVLPKWIFDVVHFSEDSSTLLDPQMLQVRESTGEWGEGWGQQHLWYTGGLRTKMLLQENGRCEAGLRATS